MLPLMEKPPSIIILSPITFEALSDSRKSTVPTMSSGVSEPNG